MLEQSVAEEYKQESYSYNYGEADLLSIPKDDQLRPRNMQNRMVFSDVQDSVLNTRNITEYAYDAFGRRIETKQYLGDYTRNLYDGFSFDVIGKTVLQSVAPVNLPDQKYRTPTSSLRQPASSGRNNAGTEIGTRYRYIDENPLVPLSGAGTNPSTETTTAKIRSRQNNEYVLYSYGEPVGMTNDSGTSYFGTDILGSVRNITDKYGSVQADYSYDAFGSPYLNNLENDIGFGYCGKIYDNGTGLYDYGFRDYSPVSARFTTVDPIRDGANWFSYVVNDPVNYIDPFGLTATDSKGGGITFSKGVFKNTNYGFTDFEFTAPTESNNNSAGSGYALNASGNSAVVGISFGVGPYTPSQKNNGFTFKNGTVLGHNDVYIGWQNEESQSSKLIKQGSIEFFIGMLLDNGAPFIGAVFAPVTGGSSIYAVPAIKAFGIVLQADGAAKIASGSILAAVEEGSGGDNKSSYQEIQKQRESAPKKGTPPGTRPLDKANIPKGLHNIIKKGVGNGPKDWTGITPDGDIIINDGFGNAVNCGPYTDYL